MNSYLAILIYTYWTICMFIYMNDRKFKEQILCAIFWPLVIGVGIINKIV